MVYFMRRAGRDGMQEKKSMMNNKSPFSYTTRDLKIPRAYIYDSKRRGRVVASLVHVYI